MATLENSFKNAQFGYKQYKPPADKLFNTAFFRNNGLTSKHYNALPTAQKAKLLKAGVRQLAGISLWGIPVIPGTVHALYWQIQRLQIGTNKGLQVASTKGKATLLVKKLARQKQTLALFQQELIALEL